jgi:regulator of protease activity HflC (stomatin/prohibitin superfamily)
MFGLTTQIIIGESQRAFLYRNKQFERLLEPGKHKVWQGLDSISHEVYELKDLFFADELGYRMVREHPQIAEQLHDWLLATDEVGILSVNERIYRIVAPGERLLVWRDAGDIELKRINIKEELAVDSELLTAIDRFGLNKASKLLLAESSSVMHPIAQILVQHEQCGLLYIDGVYVKSLAPGKYGFWQLNNKVECKLYDLKSQNMEISGQEILTKDRVSLRLNLSVNIRLIDVKLAADSVDDVMDFIYKSMQLALREAVGTKTLDDLLTDKLYINETVKEVVTDGLTKVGVKLERVGLKDIILPGEMKDILNQVVEAQKTAEANVIRRREETSATRSLHNTAKLMENNPTLLRLKELESLEKVSERVNQINVYGGLDNLMNGTVKLV